MRTVIVFYFTVVAAVNITSLAQKFGTASQFESIGTVDRKTYFAERSFVTNYGVAGQACNESGMRLATITSAAQRSLLDNAYNNITFSRNYWIGAQDALNTFQFEWDFNGEEVNCSFACAFITKTCLYYSALEKYVWPYPCAEHRSTLCEFLHG